MKAETDTAKNIEQRVRFLYRLEQKQETRGLYERIFADSPLYVDFYYNEKCRDNVIVVKEESPKAAEEGPNGSVKKRGAGGGGLLSMAHLNPYLYSVRGLTVRVCMIAAVATVPERRHEGHMRDVLTAAMDWLSEQGVPFAVLLPVDPAIYRGFGFETVCGFTEKEPPEAEAAKYDIFRIRDLDVQIRQEKEQAVEAALQAAGEEDEGWPENPVIMARVTNAEAFDRMAGRTFRDDEARLSWLRGLKICICDGV